MIEKSTIEDYDLINSVVLFGAPWCAPCKSLHPMLDGISKEYPEFQFVYLDLDKAPAEVSTKYKIKSVPTVKLFINDEEKLSISGLKPRSDYTKALDLYRV